MRTWYHDWPESVAVCNRTLYAATSDTVAPDPHAQAGRGSIIVVLRGRPLGPLGLGVDIGVVGATNIPVTGATHPALSAEQRPGSRRMWGRDRIEENEEYPGSSPGSLVAPRSRGTQGLRDPGSPGSPGLRAEHRVERRVLLARQDRRDAEPRGVVIFE